MSNSDGNIIRNGKKGGRMGTVGHHLSKFRLNIRHDIEHEKYGKHYRTY